MRNYKLETYVPDFAAEALKAALAAAGAGRYGNYSGCFWTVAGQGEFCPQPGSSPAVGEIGVTARVPEIKLETLVAECHLGDVQAALRRNHPYETPACYIFELVNLPFENEA